MSGKGVLQWVDDTTERALLTVVITHPELYQRQVAPETFHDPRNRILWAVIGQALERELPVDSVLLDGILQEGPHRNTFGAALAPLTSYFQFLLSHAGDPQSAGYYAERLLDLAWRRSIAEVAGSLLIAGSSEEQEAAAASLVEIRAARPAAKKKRDRSPQGVLAEYLEYLDTPPMPFGFDALDDLIGGGRAGENYVISALPGFGKSTLASLIARRYEGPALCWSLELKGKLLYSRMAGQITGTPWGRVGRREAIAARETLEDEGVWFEDQESWSALNEAVDELQEGNPDVPILVVMDYLQIAPDPDESASRSDNEKTAAVADYVRRWTRTREVITIMISAINRANYPRCYSAEESPSVYLGGDRGASAIEYGAASCMTLVMDPDDEGIRWVAVAKNRYGPLGWVKFRFYGDTGRWECLGAGNPVTDRWRDLAQTIAAELAIESPQSAQELRRALKVKNKRITDCLSWMADEGLIERSRGKGIKLTDEGREALL